MAMEKRDWRARSSRGFMAIRQAATKHMPLSMMDQMRPSARIPGFVSEGLVKVCG